MFVSVLFRAVLWCVIVFFIVLFSTSGTKSLGARDFPNKIRISWNESPYKYAVCLRRYSLCDFKWTPCHRNSGIECVFSMEATTSTKRAQNGSIPTSVLWKALGMLQYRLGSHVVYTSSAFRLLVVAPSPSMRGSSFTSVFVEPAAICRSWRCWLREAVCIHSVDWCEEWHISRWPFCSDTWILGVRPPKLLDWRSRASRRGVVAHCVVTINVKLCCGSSFPDDAMGHIFLKAIHVRRSLQFPLLTSCC